MSRFKKRKITKDTIILIDYNRWLNTNRGIDILDGKNNTIENGKN